MLIDVVNNRIIMISVLWVIVVLVIVGVFRVGEGVI